MTLSTGGNCPFGLDVLGNDVAAVAIWQSTVNGCSGIPAEGVVQAATFNGTWGPTATISPTSAFLEGTLEIAGTPGNAVAVWLNLDVVEAVTYIGGSWSAPAALSALPAAAPSVDGSGSSATAVWSEDGVIRAASLDAATWSTPMRLSLVVLSSYPDVVDPNGALAVWMGFDGTQTFVQAAIGSPAGPVPVVATPRTTG